MQNRNLVLQKLGLASVSAILALAGCSTTAGGGGGSGVLTGDTTGGDASLTGDTGSDKGSDTATVDVIVPSDTGVDVIVPSDVVMSDTGPSDTGPSDTGPMDTGPMDTGPSDTGPMDTAVTDTGPSKGPVWGTDDNSGSVQVLTSLQIGSASDGCVVDNSGKAKNTLSGIGSIANSQIATAVTGHKLIMLFDPKTYSTSGDPMQLNVLLGKQDPSDTACTTSTAGCKFTANPSSYVNNQCDLTSCTPQISFPDAKINGSALTATADEFVINIALGSAILALKISKVQLSGTVTDSTSWKTTKPGKLCGYILESDLNAAIDAVPAASWPSGLSGATVKGLLPVLAANDVDSTGTGAAPDAKSVALDLDTLSAIITGLTAP